MRRWLRTVSAMLVFLLLFTHAGLFIAEADAADPVFAGGSGTPDDPYVIKTFEQLDAIRQNLAAHYILGADIVLTTEEENGNDGKGFEPIGTDTNKFTGSFDGQWFRIEGLSINRPNENQDQHKRTDLATGCGRNGRTADHSPPRRCGPGSD